MKQAGNRFRRKKLLALLIIFFLSSYKVLGNESNAHNNSTRMMEAMDDIVWNINPANDSMNRVIARMREFAAGVLEAKDIDLIFSADPNIGDAHLSMEQKRDLFLIFKEAINNIAKYAHCNKVSISFHLINKMVRLYIKDDGVGFNVERADSGNGLNIMQKRAGHLKGKINISSSAGNGTTICLEFLTK